ncbi:uncharacterized protein DUF1206 [Neolewinella xylanilytica]|uniref:Uncharacterized protein DUF1206 n=1 Tax=Neolewinella xylanilytica TaxID=1514080 RepID=A0A2S6I9J7_9BACT|nr:DUF1206 domain-containing protein [Neolewinella xylanilytica]PPK88163.1 uncharacterized protein DUF1206 [Neolewinella xylanilytica]
MTKIATTDWHHQLYFWGHAAKGCVYVMVGGLALATVIGQASGGPEGPQKIVRYLQDEPFGTVLLTVLALGLFAYCGWRWYKALTDEANDGTDREGIMSRTHYAISGSMYGLLGVYTLTLVIGGSTEGDKQALLVELMQEPFGMVGVGFLALAALYAAYWQYDRAVHETFLNDLQTDKMGRKERETYRWMGKLGYGSRVIVYLVFTYFLVKVIVAQDASQYKGLGGVLHLISQGAGSVFLALIALGLFLYGAFVLVKARYRQLS